MPSTDVLATFAGIMIVALAAGATLLPLVRRTARGAAHLHAENQAFTERSALYRQVIDLEFDVQTGKLGPTDFLALREELLGRAAELVRQDSATTQSDDDELNRAIEREVAAVRRALSSSRAQALSTPS